MLLWFFGGLGERHGHTTARVGRPGILLSVDWISQTHFQLSSFASREANCIPFFPSGAFAYAEEISWLNCSFPKSSSITAPLSPDDISRRIPDFTLPCPCHMAQVSQLTLLCTLFDGGEQATLQNLTMLSDL